MSCVTYWYRKHIEKKKDEEEQQICYATLPVRCREIFSMSTGTEQFLLLAQGSFWQNVPRTNDTNNHDKLSNIISLSLLPLYTISNNVMISNLKVRNVTF